MWMKHLFSRNLLEKVKSSDQLLCIIFIAIGCACNVLPTSVVTGIVVCDTRMVII